MTIRTNNNIVLDLYPNTILNFSFKGVDLFDLTIRRVTHMNSIRIPRTPKNEKEFGYIGNIKYSKPTVNKILLTIENEYSIAKVYGIVTEAADTSYIISMYSTELSLFEFLNGKSVNILNPITSSTWALADVDTARLNTSGLISAAVQWGKSANVYDAGYFFPCFFYHTLVLKCLTATGLVVTGAILTDSLFLNLVVPYYRDTFPGGTVDWSACIVDMPCMDLLKDFTIRFGIVYHLKDGELVLKTIKEIRNNTASSLDWSDRQTSKVSLLNKKLHLNDMAISNILYYKDDVFDKSLGSYTFTINDDALVASRTLYDSLFFNSKTITYGTTLMGESKLFDSTSTSNTDIKNTNRRPKLMMLKSRTTEPTITFNAIARSDYKIAYFKDVALSVDATWETYYKNYFIEIVAALNLGVKVSRRYMMNDFEFLNLSPHKIIWDGDTYYLPSSIDKLLGGQIASVELNGI